MPIAAQCQCGAKFAAPDHLAGKSVACPKCKEPLKIPAQDAAQKAATPQKAAAKVASPAKQAPANQPATKQPATKQPATKQPATKQASAKQAAAPAANGKIPVKCGCGASFAAPANLAGKRVACPTCKQPVAIPAAKKQTPAAAAAPSSRQRETGPEVGGGINDLLDELGVEGKKIGEEYCPECSAPFPPEALICVQCGYNRKSGRKLSTVKVKQPPTKTIDLSAPKGGLKIKKKSSSGKPGWDHDYPQPWGKTTIIVLCVIVACGLLSSLLLPLVAVMIMIVGGIVMAAAQLGIVVTAFQEDIVQGLLVWLIPFYVFIFIASHLQETKRSIQMWLLGLGMMFGGLVFLIIGGGLSAAMGGG
jgi:uncharacterized protein YbaR (Trm112 family)